MKVTTIKASLVSLLAGVLIALIYLQTSVFPSNQYQILFNKLQKIDQNSVILNEYVLKTQLGLLRNYDDLIRTVDRMLIETRTLKQSQYALFQQESANIEHLEDKLSKLSISIEQFLAKNAILNNSLSFLPVLIVEIAPNTTNHNKTTRWAHQLIEQALLYNRWHDQQNKLKLEILIDKLLASSLSINNEESERLTTLISHSQVIYEYSDLVNTEIKKIFSSDISHFIALLRQQYSSIYAKNRQQAEYLNWTIYSISFILLLMVLNFIFALSTINRSLKTSNEKLILEIEHSSEIESRQRSEAQFLQTILDNISDGIVVCDHQGTLVLFNKAAQKMYGQGLKTIGADQWAKKYRLYDKQGHNLLKKHQMPLYKTLKYGQVHNEEIMIKPAASSSKTVLINGTQIIPENGDKHGAIICIRDITERKTAETEMRLAATAFEAQEGIMITDSKQRIVRVNQKFTEITGYKYNEILGKSSRIFMVNNYENIFYRHLWKIIYDQGHWQGELYCNRKNGVQFITWLSITAVKDENNITSHYVSHFRDISQEKKQQQQIARNIDEEKLIAEILKLTFLPMKEFLHQFAKAVISLPWLKLKPKCGICLKNDDRPGDDFSLVCNNNLSEKELSLCVKQASGKCLCCSASKKDIIKFSICNDSVSTNLEPHSHYFVPIISDDEVMGVVIFYLPAEHKPQDYEKLFLQRIADVLSQGVLRIKAEGKIKHLAYHDDLTGLPNRLLLTNRLEQIIAINSRQKRFSALMFIDFDRFKHINDTLGHSVGDVLLQKIAQLFKNLLRKEDTIARLGGDEFVILLTEMSNHRETAIIEAQNISKKVHAVTSKDIQVAEHSLYLTLSIGIVLVSGDEKNTETLMIQADSAMYQAKENGRNGTQFFIPEMQEISNKRMALEKDLRYALEREEIKVYYQPQFNSKNELVGAEALVRWVHPENGFVSPVDFIPIAEESRIILDIGLFVLNDACLKIKQWQSIESLNHIAVNVSPVQFRQPDFVATVKQVIAQTDIKANNLTLELTEGILVDNVNDVIIKMQELKHEGIHFSIDDFGTGYSSLSYLTRLPLDQLKIDKSFVDDIGKDRNDQIIIETIIAMADRLSYNLIAEGVETAEQIQFLKEKGCLNYQGYYFSKPLASNEFSDKYL